MMSQNDASSNQSIDAALRAIVEGTSSEVGREFFTALVKNFAQVLHTSAAWVTEYLPEKKRLRSLAFWLNGKYVNHYEYDIVHTPCEPVVEEKRCVHIPDNILNIHPKDPDLKPMNAMSYMGIPLLDVDNRVLGHLAVLDTTPLPAKPRLTALFDIFGARATAELRRLRAEADLREREEKLSCLVDSALDSIIEFDESLRVTLLNPAAKKLFGVDNAIGENLRNYLSPDTCTKIKTLVAELGQHSTNSHCLWIPGGLKCLTANNLEFPAEASLSRAERQRTAFYTLILRNINDQIEAERKIYSLTSEATYLREEIRSLQHFDKIVGQSETLLRVLRDVDQVAETDATVLILGETGTGKELIAHAIHNSSDRRDRPFIKVNCAAIPSTLIESELFGHEKGSFTGATAKREGRFALADSGTIFLDEIGDLPIDLQVKLLRVLQEGEFEPVGSSKTHKIDVRVIAATNKDLKQESNSGKFREDLYYRLNVFPILLPPLRKRSEDVVLLAEEFAKRFAQRMGRSIEPITHEQARLLKSYDWPGNVRELQNIIERAVITSQNNFLNFDRILLSPLDSFSKPTDYSVQVDSEKILTASEFSDLERNNIIKALEQSRWKVAGKRGAAHLLGLSPSTLSSRMKALKIKRP